MATTDAERLLESDASLPQRLLDLLFPPRCVHCGAAGEPLCAACRGSVREPPAPRCARCDRPLLAEAGSRCAICVASEREYGGLALERIVVASVYEGAIGSAIRALKFRRQRRLALPLARLLADAARQADFAADVIIPMPLHTQRRRERGYNQAALLARPLANALKIPLREDVLTRSRATKPQTRLSRRDRYANVAGAFALASPAVAPLLAGKRLVLVDDVTTTGATLEAAAEALLAARPTAIIALAVARPLGRLDALTDDTPLDV